MNHQAITIREGDLPIVWQFFSSMKNIFNVIISIEPLPVITSWDGLTQKDKHYLQFFKYCLFMCYFYIKLVLNLKNTKVSKGNLTKSVRDLKVLEDIVLGKSWVSCCQY